MLNTSVIYTTFFGELRQEHKDCDRFPQPGKDQDFGAGSLLLSEYIFQKIWIAAE